MYGFKIFYEQQSSEVTGELIGHPQGKINHEDPNYILNVNETEYLQFLLDALEIEPLVLHYEQVHITTTERQIPAERFPGQGFFVEAGESYVKQVIQYHIPFSGNKELLKYTPNTRV
jgi:hypothetical protein